MSEQTKPEPCYRDPNNGVHFTRNAHRIDCAEGDCRGCRPCPERHCTAKKSCTWHVAWGEITCGRCIAGVRSDLRWIEALSSLLMTAAMGEGVDSEAANLAGPAADPEAWSWRKVAARQGRAWHVSLVEDDDEHHPLTVLGTWERMIREDYGHDTDAPLSITGAVAYLTRTLHRIAQDDGQDFPLMRRELRKCRQHLEAVLHNDDRPDQGAPCPTCSAEHGKGPRLRRRYAERWEAQDASRDEWVCPANREHTWSEVDYRLRVADVYAEATTVEPEEATA